MSGAHRAWKQQLRSLELEMILARLDLPSSITVLEIGAGEGFQSRQLLDRFPRTICLDIADQLRDGFVRTTGHFLVADTVALPFRDEAFDCVISSNVLEHISDVSAALEELTRVIRPGGIMVHTMPNRVWKTLQIALYPVVLFGVVSRRFRKSAHPAGGATAAASKFVDNFDASARPLAQRRRRRVAQLLLPGVHGVSAGHRSEWLAFAPARWQGVIARHRLTVLKPFPLLFYSPYKMLPNRGLRLRRTLARLGLSSTTGYIAAKPARTRSES